MMDRGALRTRKMQPPLPRAYVPDIGLLRCDVEIPAEKDVLVYITSFVKEAAQALQPVELECEFVAPKLRAVWNVCVDNSDPVYRRGDQPFRRLIVVIKIILLNIFDGIFRNDGHAIVRFLAHESRFVTEVYQVVQWKIFIDGFRFLKANDFQLVFVEPAEKLRHTNVDRINVPGRDLH